MCFSLVIHASTNHGEVTDGVTNIDWLECCWQVINNPAYEQTTYWIAQAGDFPLFHIVRTGSGAHLCLIHWVFGGGGRLLFQG